MLDDKCMYQVFHIDQYPLPLPPGHRFPHTKYALLRELLLREEIVLPAQLQLAPMADFDLLSLAHSADYIRAMENGTVAIDIIKRVGFPWTPELFRRTSATVGGGVEAALSALKYGVAGCLAGGTHHAHFDRGEGYCVFNDTAVAARLLVRDHQIKRIAIIDLDVHQGNGNSSILGRDQEIFIASIHGEKNYPFRKVPSSIDIGLPDGATDEMYLEALETVMREVSRFEPEFIFYQMGVDPLKEDKLGKLSLTYDGLMARDETVLQYAKDHAIPISLALGGGYADPIELSIRAYANTYKVLNRVWYKRSHEGLS
jgi:acetoin utilization deacetylase AcuC-like enzyme